MLRHAWKAKAKEYRAAARFAESVYRRRESRVHEQRTRLVLAERIAERARQWAGHDEKLRELLREWRAE